MTLELKIAAVDVNDLKAQLSALAALGNASGTPTPPSSGSSPASSPGSTPTPPVDTNAYPFTNMTPDHSTDASFEAGTGPNTLQLLLAGSGAPNPVPLEAAIKVNGLVIANIRITSTTAEGPGAQSFTFHGPWGAWSPQTAVEVVGILPQGIAGIWVNAATYDFNQLYLNMPAGAGVDSRAGNAPYVNIKPGSAGAVFLSGGSQNLIFTPFQNVASTGSGGAGGTTTAPPATPTLINGQTLAQMIAAVPSGGTLTLPEGTIIGTAEITVPMTIVGAGMGKTIISGKDANGGILPPFGSKALLLVNAAGDVTIQDLTVQGAYVNVSDGQNAAGIRVEAGNLVKTLKLLRVEATDCQDGLFGPADFSGVYDFEGLNIHDNGWNEAGHYGNTHNMYIQGTTASVLKLTGSIIQGCRDGHEVKSRCGTTLSSNNKITSGGKGRCFSIDDGGIFSSDGDTLTISSDTASNDVFLGSDLVGGNESIGEKATFNNTAFSDPSGRGGIIGSFNAAATLTFTGTCTYIGTVAPKTDGLGWASVTGTVAPAG